MQWREPSHLRENRYWWKSPEPAPAVDPMTFYAYAKARTTAHNRRVRARSNGTGGRCMAAARRISACFFTGSMHTAWACVHVHETVSVRVRAGVPTDTSRMSLVLAAAFSASVGAACTSVLRSSKDRAVVYRPILERASPLFVLFLAGKRSPPRDVTQHGDVAGRRSTLCTWHARTG